MIYSITFARKLVGHAGPDALAYLTKTPDTFLMFGDWSILRVEPFKGIEELVTATTRLDSKAFDRRVTWGWLPDAQTEGFALANSKYPLFASVELHFGSPSKLSSDTYTTLLNGIATLQTALKDILSGVGDYCVLWGLGHIDAHVFITASTYDEIISAVRELRALPAKTHTRSSKSRLVHGTYTVIGLRAPPAMWTDEGIDTFLSQIPEDRTEILPSILVAIRSKSLFRSCYEQLQALGGAHVATVPGVYDFRLDPKLGDATTARASVGLALRALTFIWREHAEMFDGAATVWTGRNPNFPEEDDLTLAEVLDDGVAFSPLELSEQTEEAIRKLHGRDLLSAIRSVLGSFNNATAHSHTQAYVEDLRSFIDALIKKIADEAVATRYKDAFPTIAGEFESLCHRLLLILDARAASVSHAHDYSGALHPGLTAQKFSIALAHVGKLIHRVTRCDMPGDDSPGVAEVLIACSPVGGVRCRTYLQNEKALVLLETPPSTMFDQDWFPYLHDIAHVGEAAQFRSIHWSEAMIGEIADVILYAARETTKNGSLAIAPAMELDPERVRSDLEEWSRRLAAYLYELELKSGDVPIDKLRDQMRNLRLRCGSVSYLRIALLKTCPQGWRVLELDEFNLVVFELVAHKVRDQISQLKELFKESRGDVIAAEVAGMDQYVSTLTKVLAAQANDPLFQERIRLLRAMKADAPVTEARRRSALLKRLREVRGEFRARAHLHKKDLRAIEIYGREIVNSPCLTDKAVEIALRWWASEVAERVQISGGEHGIA